MLIKPVLMKTNILFLCAFLCAGLLFSQSKPTSSPDAGNPESPVERIQQVSDVARKTSVRRLLSPAVKNPLAAGRAGYDVAATPAFARFRTNRLTGPAYKNRKQEVRTISYGEPRRATRRQAKTGPRYKNRSAKTGG